MFLAATVTALWLAGYVALSAIVPLREKVYYDLEDADNLYKKYLEDYNKQYDIEEYGIRFEIFKESLKRINKQNAMFPQAVYGPTVFSDLTQEEREKYCGGVIPDNNRTAAVKLKLTPKLVYEEQFNWQDKGVVSPVKDQSQCGSCYIFSAIGSIEGQYAIKHQQCLSFSVQQALDCVPNNGCDGGNPAQLMNDLAADSSALMKDEDYPYTAAKGQCVEDASKKVATVLSGQEIIVDDEESLKKYLVQYGPLSIMISAENLHEYHGNIHFPDWVCNQVPYISPHAVLLVGYGEENGVKYWTIKNSWGPQWGEGGFFRLVRGIKACGITYYVATSTVA